MKTLLYISLLFLAINHASCKKDTKTIEPEPTPQPQTGTLKLEFENLVDTSKLLLGKKYLNPLGDTFVVSTFNYFISNIVLVNTDNSTFIEPNSYHLVKHSTSASLIISISGVPAGSYKAVKFMLGVDSLRNVSGAQTGDLDPAVSGSMFWSWNTGYIFMKFEGTSPKSGDPGKNLSYHIGGFGGANKTQRSFDLNFGSSNANVSLTASPIVHLSADVNQLFKSPTTIDFNTKYNILSTGSNAKLIADNYADMFNFKHIHN